MTPSQTSPSKPSRFIRPALEMGALLRQYATEVFSKLRLFREQLHAFYDIMACRTREMGGHLDVCEDCGLERPCYNSCRNRHCPQCQGSAGGRWVEKRMASFLPTHCFHIVFTVPRELRALFLGNRRVMFELLFRAVSNTLKTLSDDHKWLGAQPGITLVLHTWSKDLQFHPHIHVIITAGGLTPDGSAWKSVRGRFLFPVRVMSALFRGKLLSGLKELYTEGQLKFTGKQVHLSQTQGFESLLRELYRKQWVVYAKAPFASPELLYRYLSRYTHRVGLTNHRLLEQSGGRIRLQTRGKKSVWLGVVEFFRRFSLHILPDRFTRIRHYGLFAPSNLRGKFEQARAHLEAMGAPSAGRKARVKSSREKSLEMESTPGLVNPCPRCGGRMSFTWTPKVSFGPLWNQVFKRGRGGGGSQSPEPVSVGGPD